MAWYDWIIGKEKLKTGERWWIGNTDNVYKKSSGSGRKGKTEDFFKKPKKK